MQLAKVIGTVVATVKVPDLDGLKILMIQPLTDKKEPAGLPIAAIDSVQAGMGDLVYWIATREATLALPKPYVAVDAAITGIVDMVNSDEVGILNKTEVFE